MFNHSFTLCNLFQKQNIAWKSLISNIYFFQMLIVVKLEIDSELWQYNLDKLHPVRYGTYLSVQNILYFAPWYCKITSGLDIKACPVQVKISKSQFGQVILTLYLPDRGGKGKVWSVLDCENPQTITHKTVKLTASDVLSSWPCKQLRQYHQICATTLLHVYWYCSWRQTHAISDVLIHLEHLKFSKHLQNYFTM